MNLANDVKDKVKETKITKDTKGKNEVSENARIKKLGGMLGLARRAGRIVCGTEHVTDAIRNKQAYLVLTASDVSANTDKRISDSCAFYGMARAALPLTMSELSDCIGQTGNTSAVAITDKSFTAAIKKILELNTDVKRTYPRDMEV